MPEVFPGNGCTSTLNGAILVGATALAIQSADVAMFPSTGTYRLNLHQDALNGPWEICTVTGGQGTATLTVTRASESFRGTQAARAWPDKTKVVPVLTQGSLANPTFATILIDGMTTQELALSNADADTYGVPHGSLLRSHQAPRAAPGSPSGFTWLDILKPDGTVVGNGSVSAQHQPTILTEWPGTISAGMQFGRFLSGHFGDITQVDAAQDGGFVWNANAATGHTSALLFAENYAGGASGGYTELVIDSNTAFAGVGNGHPPSARWHVQQGDLLVDGRVNLPGLPTADPHVVGQLWVDVANARVVKQSNG